MIVIDYDNGIYELITQHDHALLAGEMASYSGKAPFGRSSARTIITAALHDVSWKRSDRDFQKAPYHFVDYPLQEKLELYKTGIDQMESIDEYIALLTSIHYSQTKTLNLLIANYKCGIIYLSMFVSTNPVYKKKKNTHGFNEESVPLPHLVSI